MSAPDVLSRTWNSPEEKVNEAGADLVAYLHTDLSAAEFAGFVRRYFPALQASAVGEDLRVTNTEGDEVFIRRLSVTGHGGVRYVKGTLHFATAAVYSVLDGEGRKKRDAKSLIDMLARFNNR